MNPNNRFYYKLNASNIISTKRVPSLTPPKNYPSSISKEKITKQVKVISGNSQQKAMFLICLCKMLYFYNNKMAFYMLEKPQSI